MPARRSRSTVRRGSAARRKTVWVTTNATGLTLAPATVGPPIDMLAAFRVAGASFIGGTVLRTHLRFEISSPNTDTAQGFYFGLVVWDKTPASIKPSPASDFDVDWMFQSFTTPGTNTNPGGAFLYGTANVYGEMIDLKARRRGYTACRLRRRHDAGLYRPGHTQC